MIEIDGSQKSGSGTILRLSVAISAITNQPLHITNIRQNRPQPGLKPQHLEAVLTAAKLSNAEVKGATLGSKEIWFTPNKIDGGDFEAEIGTAGSISMLFLAMLPICMFANRPVTLHITKGGTDTLHAPTINYMRLIFLPVLKKRGVEAEISVEKYGYYPKGMGEATMTVKPKPTLKPIMLENYGKIKSITGASICTFLGNKQVAARQTKAAQDVLIQHGYKPEIDVFNDKSNPFQKGSSIVLRADTDLGVIIGADAIGQLGKLSEDVGREAAQKLLSELAVQPTVDVFLADMLLPYMALAEGESTFFSRVLSEHVESNIWLIEKMLKVKFAVKKVDKLYRITKSN